jgi:hypothetical protein
MELKVHLIERFLHVLHMARREFNQVISVTNE